MIYLHLIKMFNRYPFLWNQNKGCKQGCREINCWLMKGITKVCNFKKIAIQIYQDQLRIQPNKIGMGMKISKVPWFIKVCLSSCRMVPWHKLFNEINKILYLGNRIWVQFKPLCHLKMRLIILFYKEIEFKVMMYLRIR